MKITILASSVFVKQMVEYRDKLIKLGHKVNLHEHYVSQANGGMKDLVSRMVVEHANVKKEYDYMRYHYKEILDSDAVIVLNFDRKGIKNYIGGNVLIELGQAYVNNKKIFLLNPIPDMEYKDEIEALEPIIINDDLSKIK